MRKTMLHSCGHVRMVRSEGASGRDAFNLARGGMCPECWKGKARAEFHAAMDAHGPQLWLHRFEFGGCELILFGAFHIRDAIRELGGWALSKRAPEGQPVEVESHTPGVSAPRVTFAKCWWRCYQTGERETMRDHLRTLRSLGVRTTATPEAIVKEVLG